MSRPAGSAMTCTPWALCLMPLWMSTARERCGSWSDADHDLVDGAGQVSLEAADYFSLRESFSRASSQVVAGGWVPAQAPGVLTACPVRLEVAASSFSLADGLAESRLRVPVTP